MTAEAVPPIYNFNTELKLKGFKVYEIDGGVNIVRTYDRKDFYKICLITSKSIIQYADKGIEIGGTTLFFGNPLVPYSWEFVSEQREGYTCLFAESFFKGHDHSESLQESPLFKIGGTPIFTLGEDQKAFLSTIFRKMLVEQETDYAFKNELIRNYISLIIHEALKMQPSEDFFRHRNASTRITSLFLELLERQFPIDNPDRMLLLRTPQDFAKNLSIHVNHLNRAVKEVTGKPTSAHIAERVIAEARALLQHTDWNVAEIAYGLGFEYPTYFNNYFKRMTGATPTSLRA